MVGLFLLALLSLLSSCYSALVKCNGTVLKIQLCNINEEEYDENLPPGSIGNPLTIKPSIILEKIAKVDDKAKRLYYIFTRKYPLCGYILDVLTYATI